MASASASVGGEEGCDTARLARDLERPDDMIVHANMLVGMGIQLNVDDKRPFFMAYKTTSSEEYGTLRRICVMLEQEEDPKCVECFAFHLEWLEEDMEAICRTTLDVVHHLLPSCRVAENAALYNKMKGDTYWFRAMLNKEDKEQLAQMVLAAHEAASEAAKGLSPAHPQQLALDLTKTKAFYPDVMGLKNIAIDLGKRAPDEAGAKLASLMDENLKLGTTDPKFKGTPDENDLKLSLDAETCYCRPKGWASLPAVVPLSKGGPPVDEFTSPGDWGYEVHEELSQREIRRSRKKAAQLMRGRMG